MTPMLPSDRTALAPAESPEKASTAAQAPLSGDNPMEHSTTGDGSETALLADTRFELLADRVSFKGRPKPEGHEMGAIRNRLAMPEARTLATVDELEGFIRSGYTIMPGICVGGTKLENWTAQQLVFLDFDNDDAMKSRGLAMLEPDDALQRAYDKGFDPLFLYFSHSATVEPFNPRYRMVFHFSEPQRNKEVMGELYDLLFRVFPEADRCSRDLTHMFLSPGKEVWRCQD